jgi:uncharacterized protein
VSTAELLLLVGAGLLAGSLNAVAGGGSLISFPALLAAGLPPLQANVTNTVSVWPGYVGTAVGYRPELVGQRPRLVLLLPTALAGAALGCALLLLTPESVFDAVVPFLVLLASLLLAVQARVAERVRAWPGGAGDIRSPLLHIGALLGAAYGAYFGGGLGVVLLGLLGLFVADGMQRLNALKNVLSLVINTVALLVFALFGPVQWASVAVLAPATLAGGYFGARVARRLDPAVLRWTIVVFGLVVGVALLLR